MYKYYRWPETQFNQGFWCFTRHRRPQDEQIFCSCGSCVFQLCMPTGWVLETSPSVHYWWRYEVGQWLGFGWFWGWGTLDMQLARWKLAKKTSPNHDGCHCPMAAMVPSSRHHHIQQLAIMLRQVCVIKTRKYYCLYYVFISYFKAQCIVDAPCLCVCGLCQRVALRVSYSQWAALGVWCSQWAQRIWILSVSALRASYSQHRPMRACMILSALFGPVTAAATKKTFGNTDDFWLTILVNIASMVP